MRICDAEKSIGAGGLGWRAGLVARASGGGRRGNVRAQAAPPPHCAGGDAGDSRWELRVLRIELVWLCSALVRSWVHRSWVRSCARPAGGCKQSSKKWRPAENTNTTLTQK